MIRSTVNATIKTIYEDVTKVNSGSIEIVSGSVNGVTAPETLEWTFGEWLANKILNPISTVSPVPSNIHWDGNIVNP